MKGKENENNFRDQLSTLNEDGSRKWIFPKKPKGKFTKYRNVVNIVLLSFLFLAPFIYINGHQLILIDLLERKFVFFGAVFGPQDIKYLVFLFLSFFVFIILFTVVFGRLFCGWICPQTIFMEGVFRKIEYWIEGDYKQQMKLKKQEWNTEKIIKKVSKWIIFYLISFLISNLFLSYVIGSDDLISIITDPVSEHVGGLIAMFVFSFIFFGVFAKVREQVCTNICPYGRLQGVLLDQKSIVVAYDHKRGENRGKIKKNEDRKSADKGDCIDCGQCVDVCPTGIDIRNGTQLECVNCTACIDACDFMMDAVNLPKGLIRYTSEEGIKTGENKIFNARSIAYSAVLVLLLGVSAFVIGDRDVINAKLLTARGTRSTQIDDSTYARQYNLTLINTSTDTLYYEVQKVTDIGNFECISCKPYLLPEELYKTPVLIKFTREELINSRNKKLKFIITNNEGALLGSFATKSKR